MSDDAKEWAYVIWAVIGGFIALAFIGFMVSAGGFRDGYKCGYRDAKRGRKPDLAELYRSDDECPVAEWVR